MYHGADLDGLCSGAIIYKYLLEQHEDPSDIILIPASYGTPIPWELVGERCNIYMADFSIQPWSEMEALVAAVNSFTWIDHHKSAIEHYKQSSLSLFGLQQIGTAACELCWNYFYPNLPVPSAVRLLSRYDVWDLDEQVKNFQYGMLSLWPEPSSYRWSPFLTPHTSSSILQEVEQRGTYIRQFVDKTNVNLMRARGFDVEFRGHKALACNAHAPTGSLLFESRWDPNKYDIMISFHLRKDGRWSLSLYTDKLDIDVSIIAKEFGGGGHQAAAGFQYDGDIIKLLGEHFHG